MSELGGGASRSTDPAAGTSAATDVSLREFIEQRFVALEARLDERRETDQKAVAVAKETADAALEAHNQLIRQMRAQATEAQRQLDKVTDTFATKENLKTLEVLIDQRLQSIEEKSQAIETAVGATASGKLVARGVWADLRSVILFGFIALAGIIGLVTFLAQR